MGRRELARGPLCRSRRRLDHGHGVSRRPRRGAAGVGTLLDGGGLHLVGLSARHCAGVGYCLCPRRPRRPASHLHRLGRSHRRRLAAHPGACLRSSLCAGPVRGGGGGRRRYLHAGHHAARRALRAGAARPGHGLVPRCVISRLRARPGGGRGGGGASGMAGRALRACPGTGPLLRALASMALARRAREHPRRRGGCSTRICPATGRPSS